VTPAGFIGRPIAVYLITLGVLLLGITAYRALPVSALPSVDFRVIRVLAELPGASPETMASSVATPLERRFGSIPAVNEMTSVNTLGNTSIILQFDLDRDVDGAARDVEAAINAAATDLPKDLPGPPVYFKASPNAFPILTIALTSRTLPQGAVYDLTDTVVSEKLSEIPGVAEVDLSGAEKTAVRIQVDPGRLSALGLGMEDVRNAVADATANEPKGSLEGRGQVYALSADDQLFTAVQYRRIIVAWRNGAAVRLGDIARVVESVANDKLAAWFNGEPAVVIDVKKQPNANVVETVDRVRAVLPQLKRWLPDGVELHITFDRTESIRASVRNVEATMLVTTLLVVLVIALFLRRFWATVIPSIAIPVAIMGTFAVMYPLGFSVDNLSMLALTIAVGFVVDDAIIVIENIARRIEAGETPFDAAVGGIRQMGFTILSITASLVSALIPILFMSGVLGRFFREFGVTLAAAVIISALVSLTLTPTLSAQFLKPEARLGRPHPWDLWFQRLTELYASSLRRLLGYRLLMIGVTLATIIGTIWLYAVVPKGLLPSQDTGALRGLTEAGPDISFAAMRARQQAAMQVISSDPAVADVTSNIGATGFAGLDTGIVNVNLKPLSVRRISADQVIDRLRPKLAAIPGITTFLSSVQDGNFGARVSKARYQFTLTGPDLAALGRAADQVVARLKAAVPIIADVSTDQEIGGLEAHLAIDRDAAARLGVSVATIDQTLYDAFGQRQVATTYQPLNQYKVVLETLPGFQQDPSGLRHLFVAASDGKQVPLSAVSRLETRSAATEISHQGSEPAITITFNTTAGVSIGSAMAAIRKTVEGMVLPDGVAGRFAGDALQAQQSNSDQLLLLLAALAGVYIVLGMLYESYLHPLTILSTLPSAGLGALLALLLTHTELTIIALIGIILLIGIVKKNAILMVDFALDAERRLGLPPHEAIVEAARLRFRPILMTTCAAVLGALPIALGIGAGAELRQPLGIAVVGGLLVSQVLTLYTTPVIYLVVDRLRGRRASREPHAPVASPHA
jgi:hydrophobe/amphiphile efflux-1 (HAE1) family protein